LSFAPPLKKNNPIKSKIDQLFTFTRKPENANSHLLTFDKHNVNQTGQQANSSDVGFNFSDISILNNNSIQTKLKISQHGDRYEKEADRVSEQILRMPLSDFELNSSHKEPPLNQKYSNYQMKKIDDEKDEVKISRKSSSDHNSGLEASSNVINEINNEKSNGRGKLLDSSTKSFMESRFRYDFSNVKIHDDSKANKLAEAVSARAFTVGNDIFLNSSEKPINNRLMLHELTHVVQQQNIDSTNTVQRVQAVGQKMSTTQKEESLAAKAVWDFITFGPAFHAGLIHGALESIWDALVGFKDLAVMLISIVQSLISGTISSDAGKLWDDLKKVDVSELITSWITNFANKWNDENSLKRGHFRGWVVGYTIAEIVMTFASGGLLAGVKWVAKMGKVAKAIQKIGQIAKVANKAEIVTKTAVKTQKIVKAVVISSKIIAKAIKGVFEIGGKIVKGTWKVMKETLENGKKRLKYLFKKSDGDFEEILPHKAERYVHCSSCSLTDYSRSLALGIGKITKKLSDAQKDILRTAGREIYYKAYPRMKKLNKTLKKRGKGLEVDHRVPLEWAHLFPNANPNRLSNLRGLTKEVHRRKVSDMWDAFRAAYKRLGREPTAKEVFENAELTDRSLNLPYPL